MTNELFAKAHAVAAALKESGHYVEITTHPTPYGNSAYVSARRSLGGVYIERGFRLSDHETGERRKGSDDFATVIDGEDVKEADLIARAFISDDKIRELAAKYAAKKAAREKEEDQFIADALAFWAELSPDQKHALAPKQHAGKDKIARAKFALVAHRRNSK